MGIGEVLGCRSTTRMGEEKSLPHLQIIGNIIVNYPFIVPLRIGGSARNRLMLAE